MRLVSHSAFPPAGVTAVEVAARLGHGLCALDYRVIGASPSMPLPASAQRSDGLWQTTCFELFVKPVGGEEYFEFNFSPSTQWAAYRFSGYRDGMADLPLDAPAIELAPEGVRVSVDLDSLPEGRWQVALTAVIEEVDGTKSYWSLAHPAGTPDFHHPDCFVFEVPAPNAA